MKNLFILFITVFILGSCSDDESVNGGEVIDQVEDEVDNVEDEIDDEDPGNDEDFIGDEETYSLSSVTNDELSGTAVIKENEDGSATVEITINDTAEGIHPAYIYFDSAAEGEDIAITLEPVDGATGTSTTQVSSLDDNTPIDYESLISFDGHINVHESADNLDVLVSQGDIGNNVLTGNQHTYTLTEENESGISGTVTISERMSGYSMVTIKLEGTSDGNIHPVHLHAGTFGSEEANVLINYLNSVDGATGISKSDVEYVNGTEPLTYPSLLEYDAHITVYESSEAYHIHVAQGGIGINAD